MKCRNCAKDLLDIRQKFCSINCQDDYICNLEKIVVEATKNDISHTTKMSKLE
jgi:hypothetical protein